ncbi:GAF domain/GGDEF domain protein [Gracilibacillus boraciitolerans JCM 21714]|uniref:GAF domain/GGDEF domain protein n=1 Tax=Gracilibacillus boraciitolerans JCM 21714 TaxID=1298598 RepID=W4VKR4_9BACI|nr:GGDEF domain-containing protein [Gracilibacillus boraciitolerans]GAE93960.1 GAF domain/GGDEF domain protein [Gracilibacillus boraciitolerans JCM 21714]
MGQTQSKFSSEQLWMEKILHIFWVMIAMAFVGQLIGLITTIYYFPDYIMEFIIHKLLVPTSIQVVIMLITHYLIKVKKLYSTKLLMITGTAEAFVTALMHPNVPGLQLLFLLVMAVFLIFFDKKKLKFSLSINIIALTSLYLFPAIRSTASEYEYVAYLFVLWAGYRIYLMVLERGKEVLKHLQQAAENEKELIVKSAMMERLSKIDALTNLYNHKTFHEYLDFLYEQNISYDMPLQLALIDIDNFKSVNDQFGHSIGDIILKRVANAIAEQVTEEDIVARYGGEEFAILLTNKDIGEAYEMIETIRLHIAAQYHEELNGNITVSVGLKDLDGSMTKESFFVESDKLLYAAKYSGKNQVVWNERKGIMWEKS